MVLEVMVRQKPIVLKGRIKMFLDSFVKKLEHKFKSTK